MNLSEIHLVSRSDFHKIESTYLKNATRERDRSSRIVREDANMDRRTAGVTGIRLAGFGLGTGGRSKEAFPLSRTFAAVTVGVEDVDAVEGGIVGVVCSSDKRTRVNPRQQGEAGHPRGLGKSVASNRGHVRALNASRKQGQICHLNVAPVPGWNSSETPATLAVIPSSPPGFVLFLRLLFSFRPFLH